MSRIGKEPVKLADGVAVTLAGQTITVKGALGELSYTMHDGISAKVEEGNILVSCADDKTLGAFHGLSRSLINNMVVGVSKGFQKQLSIEGTGFKAVLKGSELSLIASTIRAKLSTPSLLSLSSRHSSLQKLLERTARK